MQEMMRRTTVELAELARTTVERVSADVHCGGSLAYAQLVASELYESLQLELSQTSCADPARRSQLAAAIDQCRRSVDAELPLPRRIAELEATRALLEQGDALTPCRARWRFRVIEGGLSKTA